MRRLSIVLAFLFLLFTPVVHSQTRFLVGVAGAGAFDNTSAGITTSVEIPFLKHYELNLKDTFSPIESHVALGGGRANITSAGGYIWLTSSLGLNGFVEDSMYDVTKVTKDSDYAFGGLTYRTILGGLPARFSFDYIRQFNNGITPSGLESVHLQGGQIGYTMRFGCFSSMCLRTAENIIFGRVLTQGDPICDGTYGVTGGNGPNGSCPRQAAFSGGVTGSILLEFPRRRGHEYDQF